MLAEDKEYMKAIANRVPIGPSYCNRGMHVWPSTVGPKNPNERRSKGRTTPKFCKRPQGSGPVDARKTLRRTLYSNGWTNGQKPHLNPNWQKHPMQHGEICTDRCPRILVRFFQLECKYVFNIVTAGQI